MSMTLKEAIKHAEHMASKYSGAVSICWSANDNRQLAVWLRELAERRKTPEIVRCCECRYFEDLDLSGYCNNQETYAIKTDSDFGCILGKRRTDA